MKNSDTPISLFSFQDIVTSLTGIMVIVILVIVLQLVEATYNYENPKSDNPEYLELKEKQRELSMQIQNMKNMGEEIPEELKEYIHVSQEAVDEQIKQAQNAISMMKSEMEKNNQDLVDMSDSLKQRKELLTEVLEEKKKETDNKNVVDNEMKKVEEDKDILALERRLQALQEEANHLKDDIVLSDKLEFSFEGVMTRQPILIECLGDGFRAQVYKEGEEIKSFMDEDFDSNLSSLLAWLKKKDLKKSYPVLLLREKAFSQLDKIQLELFKLDRNIVLGKEPLDDNVKVF